MAEYVGDETLGIQVSVYKRKAAAIVFLLDNIVGGLKNEGHGYAQEYVTWHSEELLEKAAKEAEELAAQLRRAMEYTRVAANRNGANRHF